MGVDRMTFCGQLRTDDLAAVRNVDGWNPPSQLLSFFADKSPESDETEHGIVLVSATDQLVRQPAPSDLDEVSRFDEAPVDVLPSVTVPGVLFRLEDWGFDFRAHHEQVMRFDGLVAHQDGWRPGRAFVRHQFFGQPPAAQDFWLPEGWRLLFCLCADERLSLELADGGRLMFILPTEQLAAGDYSDVSVALVSG